MSGASDIIVGVRLNADGSGLVGQLRLSKAEMDQLRVAEKGAADAARDLATATAEAGAATSSAGQNTRSAVAATEELGSAGREAAIAVRDLADAGAGASRAQVEATQSTRALMGDLDLLGTSARAVAQMLGEIERVAGQAALAQAEEARQARDAAAAHDELTRAQREEQRVLGDFLRLIDPAAAKEAELNRQIALATQLRQKELITDEQLIRIKQLLNETGNEQVRNLGLQRAGFQNAGYQVQDFLVQVNGGTSALKAFSMQGPQLVGSLQMIAQSAEGSTGKMGGLINLLAGGWGVALGVAIPLAAMLAEAFFNTGSAADKASSSTIDFTSTLVANQGAVTGYTTAIDQLSEATRGLINTQALLIDNSRRVAQATVSGLSTELASIDKQIADLRKSAENSGGILSVIFGLGDANERVQLADLQRQRGVVQQALESARGSYASAQTAFEGRTADESADPKAGQRAQIARERARLEERRRYTINLGDGVPLVGAEMQTISGPDFEKEMRSLKAREIAIGEAGKKSKEAEAAAKRAAKEQERLINFGDRSENAISRLNDQFNDAPKDIDRARQATAQLDDIIADLEKRKPPNYQVLIEQAKAIKPLIADSLSRPIRDMLVDQEREIALGDLRVKGRQADAQALQFTYQLMDKLGVESEEQLATELAKRGVTGDQVRQLYENLAVMREQTREQRAQEELQRAWLNSIAGMRENIRLTLRDLRTEGPKAIGDFFKRSRDVLDNLFADVVTEKLFGGLFRGLTDQVTGADKVSAAGDRIAASVDKASASLGDLAAAAKKTAGAIDPTVAGAAGGANNIVAGDQTTKDAEKNDIVVDGIRKAFRSGYEDFFKQVFRGFSSILEDVFGAGGSFSKNLPETLGKALAGGQFGSSVVSTIFGSGSQGSQIGSFIGGAIGEKVGEKVLTKALGKLGDFAGPIGSIVGAIGGSLLGGLIKGKPMLGSSVLTSVDQADPGIWGRLGGLENVGAVDKGVQQSLKQIISALGGKAGDFSVGIGNVEYNGQSVYRVSGDGRYDVGTQDYYKNGGTTIYDGTDASEALKAAVRNAIQDGAVAGISAAMKKALTSTDDVDEGVRRALKVGEVEQLLDGLGDTVTKSFQDFEAQAAERLQIARDYGLDVVALEKKTAEQRTALLADLADKQTGSLKSLLDDLSFGSLADGSAADKRKTLKDKIAAAQTDALAGKDGAADIVASLTRQLLDLDRSSFGTAGGELATDKANAISSAEAIIKAENDRLRAAQDAAIGTNTRLDTTNSELSTQTDLLGRITTAIEQLAATTGQTASSVADDLLLAASRKQAL